MQRLPTKLKLLRNTARPSRMQNEPQPALAIPPCPSHLDEEARREWRSMSKQLLDLGLMTKADKAALAAYCVAWSNWVEATEKLKTEGKVCKSPTGYPILSPWWAIATMANKQMHRYLTEFGLSPASRSRISAQPPKKEESKLSKYLGGKTA